MLGSRAMRQVLCRKSGPDRAGLSLGRCQTGYFYYEGLGAERDLAKALYWTRRAAEHGDRDGQCNLAWYYEEAIGVERDISRPDAGIGLRLCSSTAWQSKNAKSRMSI